MLVLFGNMVNITIIQESSKFPKFPSCRVSTLAFKTLEAGNPNLSRWWWLGTPVNWRTSAWKAWAVHVDKNIQKYGQHHRITSGKLKKTREHWGHHHPPANQWQQVFRSGTVTCVWLGTFNSLSQRWKITLNQRNQVIPSHLWRF